MKKVEYQVLDDGGVWRDCSGMEAASYKIDGATIRNKPLIEFIESESYPGQVKLAIPYGGAQLFPLARMQEIERRCKAFDGLVNALQAMKRCPGVYQTDQETASTFDGIIDAALSEAGAK